MVNYRRENTRMLREMRQRQEYGKPREGRTGIRQSDGNYHPSSSVGLPAGWIWVTFDNDHSTTRAKPVGVNQYIAGLEVEIKEHLKSGELHAFLDIERAADAYGLETALSLAKPEPAGDLERSTVQSKRLKMGRLYAPNGDLVFRLYGFWYRDPTGKKVWWRDRANDANHEVDLSGEVPGSTGQHKLVIISHNPDAATPSLEYTASSDISTSTTFTEAHIEALLLDVPQGYKSKWAVELRNGDTAVPDNQLWDLREWGAEDGGTADDAIHDNVAGEIAALTEKENPVSADLVLIEDSEDDNNKKKVQVGNLPGGGGGGGGSENAYQFPNSSLEVWENGTASAPDFWTVTGSGATVAREGTTKKHGSYSAALTRVGNDCSFTTNLYTVAGGVYVRGREITFGAWVYATVASRARLVINDGVGATNSSYHSGGSGWELLTVTRTLDGSATALTVGLEVNTGNTTAYIDACTLVDGDTLSAYQPQAAVINQFPRRATMWHEDSLVIAGGALAISVTTGQAYNAIWVQSSGAQNDAFTNGCLLAAGTYTLMALGRRTGDAGIITWYVDGVSVGTTDFYGAAAVNLVQTVSGIVIATDGWHEIRGVMATKNASSNFYYWYGTKITMRQSAD